MGDGRTHLVVNVYGDEDTDVVKNALAAAKYHTDADTDAEAFREIAAAYTGWDG